MALYRVNCVYEVLVELLVEADDLQNAENIADMAFDHADYSPERYFSGEEINPACLDEDELEEVIRK